MASSLRRSHNHRRSETARGASCKPRMSVGAPLPESRRYSSCGISSPSDSAASRITKRVCRDVYSSTTGLSFDRRLPGGPVPGAGAILLIDEDGREIEIRRSVIPLCRWGNLV